MPYLFHVGRDLHFHTSTSDNIMYFSNPSLPAKAVQPTFQKNRMAKASEPLACRVRSLQ